MMADVHAPIKSTMPTAAEGFITLAAAMVSSQATAPQSVGSLDTGSNTEKKRHLGYL